MGEGNSTAFAARAIRLMTAALDTRPRRAPTRRFRFADPSMILWLV